MNVKGQVVVFTLMLGVVIIILAIAFAPVVLEMTTNSMNVTQVHNDTNDVGEIEYTGMNCTGTTDMYVKAGCVVVDTYNPYLFGFLLAVGAATIGARIAFGS